MTQDQQEEANEQLKQPYSRPRIEEIGTVVSHTDGSGALSPDADSGVSTPTGR